MKNKLFKLMVSFALIFSMLIWAPPAGYVQAVGTGISCNVSFTKPAICCDVGQTALLAQCGVQFSAALPMVTSDITWKYGNETVTEFTPDAAGVYALTATANGNTATVYVVAKEASADEYVLYSNDFTSAPTDLRVIQQSSGATVTHSNGTYVLNASNATGSYIRVLMPSFLDAFGDAVFTARIKVTNATDAKKWGALMYRVQNGNYPYMQACIRYDSTAENGMELSHKDENNSWDVYRCGGFDEFITNGYNVVSVAADGVASKLSVNGKEVLSYSATHYDVGAFGLHVRAATLTVDSVKITLAPNESNVKSAKVGFAKPALRCDMGDTVKLSDCAVQFSANALYTKGNSLTWTLNGATVTEFTPTAPGVTALQVSNGSVTKTVYVVARALYESEYVLYYNDFTSAPGDFRVVQQTSGTTVTHSASAGTYTINASASNTNYGRVLLPAWLDVFGDLKFEAKLMQSGQNTEKNWSSLMYRVQNTDYPYMQVCMRYNAALTNGLEIAERTTGDIWSVKVEGTYADKLADYNVVALVAKANSTVYWINEEKVLEYNATPYVAGGLGLQAKGLSITVDYVKVSLGETTAEEDGYVSCAVSYTSPAICCDAGQTVLLSDCPVQFGYGVSPVNGTDVVWKKDGAVITEFEATEGIHELTAVYGNKTMRVFVVAKKTTASEYVLYYNDFSADPSSQFRAIEGKGTFSSGTYVLNASASKDTYVRVLLPEYLDVFGDYTYTASVKFTSPVDNTKWGAMMYRVQNANLPFLQGCIRYDATASNGTELSQRTADATWTVTQKGAYTGLTANAFNTVKIDSYGKTSTLSINGTTVLTETATPFQRGGLGFYARGLVMTLDYVKVTVPGNSAVTDLYTLPGEYADVRDPETGISIAPALITEIKTQADFDNIAYDTPAVAIMTYDVVNGTPKIVFADGSATPEAALSKLGGVIIPAFRIGDNTDADSLAAFLTSTNRRDAYAVSVTPSVVDRAYSGWKYIRGVVDYTAVTAADAEDLRFEALSNSARVVMLNSAYATKKVVTTMQDSYSVVWTVVGEGEAASVAAINTGVYGVVTPDRAVTEACMKKYYLEGTLTRRSNVIGHRGVPSLAQENSIAGAATAYEQGATMVENDIYKVADGVLMVMHDSTIDRTTTGSGNTVDFTSTQLSKYVIDYNTSVATEPIPSLEDYFKLIKGKAGQKLVIEIKPNDTTLAKPLADLINKYDIIDQVVIISFKTAPMLELRKHLPGIAIGYLSSSYTLDEGNALYTASTIIDAVQDYMSVFNPKYTGLGENLIRELAYRGITVWPYTINDQATFDKYFVNSVAGITTNYSQWSKTLVSSLEYDGSQVKSTTYNGTVSNVSSKAELVVVEDSLGISFTNGKLTVPSPAAGGKASFFFRLKSTTGTGISYYTVTELQTVEVAPTHSLELIASSALTLEGTYLAKLDESFTVAKVKAQFVYEVGVLGTDGAELDDSRIVPTGATVYLKADPTLKVTGVLAGDINGDALHSAADLLALEYYIMGKAEFNDLQFKAADLNFDALPNTSDGIMLENKIK